MMFWKTGKPSTKWDLQPTLPNIMQVVGPLFSTNFEGSLWSPRPYERSSIGIAYRNSGQFFFSLSIGGKLLYNIVLEYLNMNSNSFFLIFLIGGKLLYNVLVSAMQQHESVIITHTHTYITPPSLAFLPSPYSTPLGHHRAPGWAPCVTQHLPTSSLFYT